MSRFLPSRRNRNLVNKDFDDFDDFYNMVDDFFNWNWPSRRNFMRDTFKVDVEDNKDNYLVTAELPGVNKDEVDIEMNEGTMNISIKREENVDEENKNYIHKERRYSSMSRNIYLEDAKSQGIKANLDNGVLKITVPKESKPDSSVKIDID